MKQASAAQDPFFSIITVVYNDLDGLRRTEASIRRQTETDFEWRVVDGGSTDGTAEFLRSLDLPYLYWTSERDHGIYDAMNKGTAGASGRYLVYMNGGDAFKDDLCLSEVRHCLERSNYPELLYGGANWRFTNGTTQYRAPRKMETAIRHGLPGMHQATFYRRDFLDSPPYDLSYPVSADYYLSARCFRRGARAVYLNRALADFSVGGNSMKKANQSLCDAWRIQREVLGLGLSTRLTSVIRRFVAHRALACLHRFKKS
jgi:putative colanic acid biosynthesis glycosyltransferase